MQGRRDNSARGRRDNSALGRRDNSARDTRGNIAHDRRDKTMQGRRENRARDRRENSARDRRDNSGRDRRSRKVGDTNHIRKRPTECWRRENMGQNGSQWRECYLRGNTWSSHSRNMVPPKKRNWLGTTDRSGKRGECNSRRMGVHTRRGHQAIPAISQILCLTYGRFIYI